VTGWPACSVGMTRDTGTGASTGTSARAASISSAVVHGLSAMPAVTAGVVPSAEWMQQKL